MDRVVHSCLADVGPSVEDWLARIRVMDWTKQFKVALVRRLARARNATWQKFRGMESTRLFDVALAWRLAKAWKNAWQRSEV